MEGDQIDKLFEKRTEEFINNLPRPGQPKVVVDPDQPKDEVVFVKLKPAESAAGTSMTREMKERHDLDEMQRKRAVAEGAPVSAAASTVLRPNEVPAGFPKPLDETVDSIAKREGPLNGRETARPPRWLLEQAITELEAIAKRAQDDQNPRITADELQTRFAYHQPKDGDGKAEKYRDVRMKCWALADFLCGTCPPSRELSLALTKLEEVMFFANGAIARRG